MSVVTLALHSETGRFAASDVCPVCSLEEIVNECCVKMTDMTAFSQGVSHFPINNIPSNEFEICYIHIQILQ